jgi:hypothetical protein
MKHTSGWFVLVFALAAGCAPAPSVRWFREDVHPVAVKGDRRLDQAKIWSGDSILEWHAVLITRDSISGIPYTLSGCENCRRALPVFAVDSLSVGYSRSGGGGDDDHESPWWAPLLILALIFCP